MFSINVTFNYTVECYCDVLCYTIKIITLEASDINQ